MRTKAAMDTRTLNADDDSLGEAYPIRVFVVNTRDQKTSGRRLLRAL